MIFIPSSTEFFFTFPCYDQVSVPNCVKEYNLFMGGVDKMDSLCALHKYNLRSKRWYMYLFHHLAHECVINAWLLYKRDNPENSMLLRKFIWMVATSLAHANKPSSQRMKRQRLSDGLGTLDVRFDTLDHFPTWNEKRNRCKLCTSNNSWIVCSKCKVYLCCTRERNCFLSYHKQ
jgi:hypothetical protein